MCTREIIPVYIYAARANSCRASTLADLVVRNKLRPQHSETILDCKSITVFLYDMNQLLIVMLIQRRLDFAIVRNLITDNISEFCSI